MKLKEGFVLRQVAGQYIVMPTGENVKNFQGAIMLNEVSALIWETLEKDVTKQEIVDAVTAAYDVSAEKAAADIDSTIAKFKEAKLLED